MWFDNNFFNFLIVAVPILLLMWYERPKGYTDEDYDRAIKHFEKLEKERNSDPRNNDPFYLSDKHRALKEDIVANFKKSERDKS